jgi:hypothetical protein
MDCRLAGNYIMPYATEFLIIDVPFELPDSNINNYTLFVTWFSIQYVEVSNLNILNRDNRTRFVLRNSIQYVEFHISTYSIETMTPRFVSIQYVEF